MNNLRFTNTLPKSVILITVFLFSLWDFYLPQIGIRLFDFFGIGILCLWMLCRLTLVSRQVIFSTNKFFVINLLIVWGIFFSILGIAVSIDNAKPIIGFLMGIVLFVFFYSIKIDVLDLEISLGIIILMHVACLLFQYIYYLFFGVVLNFYGFLGGEEPRALSSIFRPTGLFLEPAAYSVSMLMLIIIRYFIINTFDKISIFAIISIFLTLSLWGLIASSILILIYMRKNIKFYAIYFAVIILIFIFIPFIPVDWLNANDNPWMRLMNLGDDSSTNSRFGGLVNFESYVKLFIGKGVGNDYHDFGSSGIAFIMSAGGLFGFCMLLFLLFKLIRKEQSFLFIILIILCMSAAPIWTTMYWWLWLALMTRYFYSKERRLIL